MDFEQIKELITLIDSSDLAFFELTTGNNHIKMDKSLNRGEAESNRIKNYEDKNIQEEYIEKIEKTAVKEEIKTIKNEDVKEEKNVDINLSVITSPMVGTFYSSASPEAPAFVKPGDIVSTGKIICIIEAMKLMNEIESEYNGEIVECLVKNGDMVEYGQPLFKIREA